VITHPKCGVGLAADSAAGKRDLPAMIGKMSSSLCEQHAGLAVLNNWYQHRRRPDGPYRRNGCEHGGVSVVRVMPWRNVRIGESYRNIERKPFLRTRENSDAARGRWLCE